MTLGFSFRPSASYFFTDAHDSQYPNPCVKCVQGNANLCIWGKNEIVSFLNIIQPPLQFRKGVCWTDIDALLISPRHCPLMPNTLPVGKEHSYTDRNQNKNPESTDFTIHYLVKKQQASVTLDWHSCIIPSCRYKSSIYPTFKGPFSLRVTYIGFKVCVNRHMAHWKVH